MRIDRARPGVLRVTLSAYELAALMAAARWVVEGAEGELATEARAQLRQVLLGYEAALRSRESAGPTARAQADLSERAGSDREPAARG